MRLALFTLALLPGTAFAQQAAPAMTAAPVAAKKDCQNAKKEWAKGASVRVQPLNREPLADQYLPVLRTVEGCDLPVKIREDVGRTQR